MTTDHHFLAILEETSVSKLWWKVSSDYPSLGQSAVKALLQFGSVYLGGGIFPPMKLIQTRQKLYDDVFYLTGMRRPHAVVSFYWPLGRCCYCGRLFGSRHRLLSLPDTRRTTQRGQSVGPALIGEAGEKVRYTGSWNQTLSWPSVLCHIK